MVHVAHLENGDIGLVWVSQSESVHLHKVEGWDLPVPGRTPQVGGNLIDSGCLARTRHSRDVHTSGEGGVITHDVMEKFCFIWGRKAESEGYWKERWR